VDADRAGALGRRSAAAAGRLVAVQSFLPYADNARSAAVLDDRRLGKQRVNCLRLLVTFDNLVTEFHESCSECSGGGDLDVPADLQPASPRPPAAIRDRVRADVCSGGQWISRRGRTVFAGRRTSSLRTHQRRVRGQQSRRRPRWSGAA
jgi:hypothetical protein